MSKLKLHLTTPKTIPAYLSQPGAWDKASALLMDVLREKYNLKDESSMCGVKLGELFHASELRDITLLATGSDWPGKVLMISTLELRGDGPCPNCGSDDNKYEAGEYTCRECETRYPTEEDSF